MKHLIAGIMALLLAGCSQQQPEAPPMAGPISVTGEGVTGTVERYTNVPSDHVPARNVDIWLPPGYDSTLAYPVVYMHDGQNLFDPSESYIGVDWGVDETMTALMDSAAVRPAIIVGVWNTPNRMAEYMPEQAISLAPIGTRFRWWMEEGPVSDAYLRFLVEELKPFIDARYATSPDASDTFTMGSSMGGLISAYAVMSYPDIFGGAGCVSTHWPIHEGIVVEYLAEHLPNPGSNKFYFDDGTETLDAQYAPFQVEANAIMQAAGYIEEVDWMTRVFEGTDHSERAWRERVHLPLTFLLGK